MKKYKNAVTLALVLGGSALSIGGLLAANPMEGCQAMGSASKVQTKSMGYYASKDGQKSSRMMNSCPMSITTTVAATRKVYSKGGATVTQPSKVSSMPGCPMTSGSGVKAMASSCCQ